VKGGSSGDGGEAIKQQMLSNQLGLSPSRDRGAEILWAPKDFERGLQAFVQSLVAACQDQHAIGMTTAELGSQGAASERIVDVPNPQLRTKGMRGNSETGADGRHVHNKGRRVTARLQ